MSHNLEFLSQSRGISTSKHFIKYKISLTARNSYSAKKNIEYFLFYKRWIKQAGKKREKPS